MNKKFLSKILIISMLFVCNLSIFAHDAILNIEYDNCILSDNTGDGDDEMWYCISNAGEKHISEQVTTIKYYFEDCRGEYYWT